LSGSLVLKEKDFGNHEITGYSLEECSWTIKESSWWSFSSTEKTITGPCEELKELMQE